MAQFQENTKPLLRHNQIQDYQEEAKRLEGIMSAPPHVAAQIQDMGEVRRQLFAVKTALETQTPQPYTQEILDGAVAREAELREQWMQGMPTQAEMRRNPAGARDKHVRWERANKEKILEWKNIRLRLHASGYLNEAHDATDIANIERYRPREASHELNMHNEQIPGKVQFGPVPGAGPVAVMTDAESEVLKAADPDLHAKMALLDNDSRRRVIEAVQKAMGKTVEPEPEPAPEPVATTLPKTEIAGLRAEAKALGINSFGMGKDALRRAISERKG